VHRSPFPRSESAIAVTQIDALKDMIKSSFTGSSDTVNWAGRFEFHGPIGNQLGDLMWGSGQVVPCLNPRL